MIGIHRGETGPAGAAGPIGPAGITWQGAWSGSKSGGYVPRDAVYYGGSSYIATAASSNVTPVAGLGTSWDLLALAGQAGQAGDTEDTFHRSVQPSAGTGAAGISVGAPVTYTYMGETGGDTRASISSIGQYTTVFSGSGTPDVAYVSNSALTSDDHHAQVTVGSGGVFPSGGAVIGVFARMSTATATKTGYCAFFTNFGAGATWRIWIDRWTSNSATVISPQITMPSAPVVNDVLKVVVSGSTISAFLNGALVTSVVNETANATGKYCGFMANANSAGAIINLSDFRYGLGS